MNPNDPSVSQSNLSGASPIDNGASGIGAVPLSARVGARRELFWNNVVRDSLMALAAAASNSSGRLKPTPSAAQHSVAPVSELFDGRIAVLTAMGQRIPIADIFPVFACSAIGGNDARQRSQDVQCTVFRITTPSGEIYTLPISQIVAVHSMTQELLDSIGELEQQLEGDEEYGRVPFGFAAYTSVARAESEADDNAN